MQAMVASQPLDPPFPHGCSLREDSWSASGPRLDAAARVATECADSRDCRCVRSPPPRPFSSQLSSRHSSCDTCSTWADTMREYIASLLAGLIFGWGLA